MRYQSLTYSCGAAAVVNVLRSFGRRVCEADVRKAAGTDQEGTNPTGVIAALRCYGLTVHESEEVGRSRAWAWLHGSLVQGRPAIITVDSARHWVACVGHLGQRIVLVDSLTTTGNRRENGTHILSRPLLLRRWASSRSNERTFYGISAGKGS
jgi:ABC-type bacteriocin/lantibiotic exporter with double-glycine peptidase domain